MYELEIGSNPNRTDYILGGTATKLQFVLFTLLLHFVILEYSLRALAPMDGQI
jgi:hypothetical protein